LNLTEGSIKSYNFSLRGESDAGYIYITSNDETNGKPLIELSSKINNNDVKLLIVSPDAFELTSPNFNSDSASGINLDVLNGSLEVKNQNKTLMAITDQAFTLTSSTFLDSNNNKNSGM
jgi:hypothetical protein